MPAYPRQGRVRLSRLEPVAPSYLRNQHGVEQRFDRPSLNEGKHKFPLFLWDNEKALNIFKNLLPKASVVRGSVKKRLEGSLSQFIDAVAWNAVVYIERHPVNAASQC